MARRTKLWMLLGVTAILPHVASANAGTPLMWAGMFHLLLGNVLIGLCEGAILLKKYDSVQSPFLLMVGANYVSAWLGGFALNWFATLLDWNLNNGLLLFWLFAVLTYLMTIFVEWPFVCWCFPKENRNWKQSLRASWLIQTCSYVVLFTGYWLVSSTSIYSRVEVVRATEIALLDKFTLFHLGTDRRVYQNNEILGDFVSTNRNDRLYFEPSSDTTNTWDLYVRVDAQRDADARFIRLAASLNGRAASADGQRQNQGRARETWFNFGEGLNVGLGTNANWHLRSGFWPIEGLRVRNEQTSEQYRFSWETLFSQWPVRNVMQLPNDQAIFQLGEDQICVLDLRTKRIALLARGWGPAVLLK